MVDKSIARMPMPTARLEPADITTEKTQVVIEDATDTPSSDHSTAPAGAHDGPVIQSVDRALMLLELLAEQGDEMRLQDIAQAANLNASTCHHLLKTLLHRGFVTRSGSGKTYAVGPRLKEIAAKPGARFDLSREAIEDLEQLARRLGTAASLAILSQTSLTLLRQSGSGPTWGASPAELARACHATAVGKAILAWLPETEIARVVADFGMSPFTGHTITSLGDLVESLRQIRRHGFAIEDQEFRPGIVGVACAIRTHAGAVIGSAGVQLSKETATIERIREVSSEVVRSARDISNRLR